LGDHLFTSYYHYLAGHGVGDKYSVRSIQILFKLYPEAWGENGVVEIGSEKSET